MSDRRKPFSALTLGAQVFSRRTALGLSQAALAERIGVSPLVVLRYEHGRNLPRADRLRALALALNVSADELLGIGR